MALGNWVRIAVSHIQSGSSNEPWYTTYQSFCPETEYLYDRAQRVMQSICEAEAQLYYNTVTIVGAVTSRYQLKTTVPNPSPPPYNPADHTSVTTNLIGTRGAPSGEQLYYDQVLDFERHAEFGNPGHIELRGALTDGEVDTTLSTKKLTTTALAAWATRLGLFETDLSNIETDEGVGFGFITQPQTSIVWTVTGNKPKATRTYGAVSVRAITNWSLGRVRSDKGHAKYFDTGS